MLVAVLDEPWGFRCEARSAVVQQDRYGYFKGKTGNRRECNHTTPNPTMVCTVNIAHGDRNCAQKYASGTTSMVHDQLLWLPSRQGTIREQKGLVAQTLAWPISNLLALGSFFLKKHQASTLTFVDRLTCHIISVWAMYGWQRCMLYESLLYIVVFLPT